MCKHKISVYLFQDKQSVGDQTLFQQIILPPDFSLLLLSFLCWKYVNVFCSTGETDQFTDLVKNIIFSLNKPFCPNLAARYQLDNRELLT